VTPIDLDDLATLVPDGALLALPPDNSLVPSALARALVRRGARELRLLGVPVSGYATDLLIGAGCVASVQTSAVTLAEAGTAPRFTAAVAARSIAVIDATCPAIHTMLQAAEKGVPFMPLRGVLGSDLLAHRPDWRVIDNPFASGPFASESFEGGPFQSGGDPILLLPALSPDVAAFHAVCADAHGNVFVGRRRELATLAHASRRVLVTVERMVDGNLLEDERLAAGVISALYVDHVAVAAHGAWPIGLLDEYPLDAAHLADYARLARSDAGFAQYLAEHVHTTRPSRAA
jgi:glutaconate CoA-transferase subunit A